MVVLGPMFEFSGFGIWISYSTFRSTDFEFEFFVVRLEIF